MATAVFGQKEARRKKWITGAVIGALALTIVGVGVAYWVGMAQKEKPLPTSTSVPANVHQQLSGYTVTRSDGGRQIFTVHAARTVAFKEGGTTVLEDVMVEVFGKAGNRHDLLRTQRCDYNPGSGDFFSSGRVEIEINAARDTSPLKPFRGRKAVHLETSKVSFRNAGSTVVSDAPLRFTIGPASGTARGMTYGTREGWLQLESEVALELQPPGAGRSSLPIRLRAQRLRYDKSVAQIALGGPLEITQGTRRVLAEGGMVHLDSQDRITRVDLTGGVKGSDLDEGRSVGIQAKSVEGDFDPATRELTHLLARDDVEGFSKDKDRNARFTAQQLELDFAGEHPKPARGVFSGNVELTSEPVSTAAGAGASPQSVAIEKKSLTASVMEFSFRPQGLSVQEAHTVGPGKLVVIPPDPKVGARVVTAGQLLMGFDAKSQLESLRGLPPTRVIFQPPANAAPGSVAQESSADRLDAAFDTASQALKDVRQSGNFEFRDGERRARSAEAHYAASTDGLVLTGHPQVWDSRSRVKCEEVKINLRGHSAEGQGGVQATQLQAPSPAKAEAEASPIHILSDRMVAEQGSQTTHYEGHVRAWQGLDVVEAPALDVYRAERRVSGGSPVLTSHSQPAQLALGAGRAPASTASPESARPVTVRADRLAYLDEGRAASYRGSVRLQTESTILEADRMDVYFSSADPAEKAEIDRAVAEGHVKVTQPGRHAVGEHGEYFAGPGKIVLTGGPPVLDDVEKGSTTGQRLTFFIHDDTLLVDGGKQLPAVSKHRVAP